MKKTVLHAALFAISLPMSLYGLGLGGMKVKSSLDQPLMAEIELIDVNSAALSTIKVGLADPENFERVGLERIAVLSLLNFKIGKNDQGKFVIIVQSQERISEPYLDIVIDLAWPNGQLFKAYTILLDPPGYQLQSATQQTYSSRKSQASYDFKESGVINKTVLSSADHSPLGMGDAKSKTTYGPTITNENVWQIAQHYKTSELSLPQVVLAIVGANPESFTEGNLNGLKVGVRLTIPATMDIQTVPADLSTQEVMAHDTAWNDKKPINHVISPPYMTSPGFEEELLNNFKLPTVPRLSTGNGPSIATLAKLIQINSAVQIENKDQSNLHIGEREATAKAELSITTAAVEAVRESIALLTTQLRTAQEQNKKLQEQLAQRDKDLEAVRAQLQVMVKEREAVASQASSSLSNNESFSLAPLFLLLLLAAGGGSFAFWHFKRKEEDVRITSKSDEVIVEQLDTMPELRSEPEPIAAVTPTQEIFDEDNIEKEDLEQIVIAEDTEEETKSEKMKSARKKNEFEVDTATAFSEPVVDEKISIEVPDANQNIDVITATAPVDVVSEDKIDHESEMHVVESIFEEQPKAVEEAASLEFVQTQDPISVQEPIEINKTTVEPSKEETQLSSAHEPETKPEETASEFLEFETGLHHLVEEKNEIEGINVAEEDKKEQEESIDFIPNVSVDTTDKNDNREEIRVKEQNIDADLNDLSSSITGFFVEPGQEDTVEIDTDSKMLKEDNVSEFENVIDSSMTANPLKSTKALDTLLLLAKTYIGMDDFESARNSLEEIIEHGSDSQKSEANQLLDEIKDK